ncbi:MAG: hypothetical protein ACO27O_01250 [Hylemonella sp.]
MLQIVLDYRVFAGAGNLLEQDLVTLLVGASIVIDAIKHQQPNQRHHRHGDRDE